MGTARRGNKMDARFGGVGGDIVTESRLIAALISPRGALGSCTIFGKASGVYVQLRLSGLAAVGVYEKFV